MLASELITQLQDTVDKFGDRPVRTGRWIDSHSDIKLQSPATIIAPYFGDDGPWGPQPIYLVTDPGDAGDNFDDSAQADREAELDRWQNSAREFLVEDDVRLDD